MIKVAKKFVFDDHHILLKHNFISKGYHPFMKYFYGIVKRELIF